MSDEQCRLNTGLALAAVDGNAAILVDKVACPPAELSAALPLAVWNLVPAPTITRMLDAGADLLPGASRS